MRGNGEWLEMGVRDICSVSERNSIRSSVFSNFRIDFPHVLGLDICSSDLMWFLELRRLRRSKLKEVLSRAFE